VDWPTDGTSVSFKKIGEWPGSLISRDSNTACATAFIRLRSVPRELGSVPQMSYPNKPVSDFAVKRD
jgi:hypothetical protein